MRIKLLAVIGCCIFFASCESNEPNQPQKLQEPIKIRLTTNESDMTEMNSNFALKFFSAVYENESNENIVISPFSMSMALAMVRNGAESETKQAIQEAMGMGDFPETEINDYFKKLRENFIKTDPSLSLAIANSIWYDKNRFQIKNDFVELNRTYYNAPVTGLDYSSPDALKTVNKWCSDNTNGLIDKILDRLYDVNILNALYFKGDWTYKFDKQRTRKQAFSKEDGTSVNADMMSASVRLDYYEDEYLSSTALPYGNEAYRMLFLLPKAGVSFNDMLNRLQAPDYWATCISYRNPCEVDVLIPKFKLSYENKELTKVLSQMGMEIACNKGRAYFPHIAENVNFYIANVTQKTYIEVDEEGTEAAAVTSIGMAVTGIRETPSFVADHPFLFAIQENSTGSILFVGKIGNPAP
ncbi:serpin family protein [Viscerimonas tarda]